MLTQRLAQHGVITDLTKVGPEDVATMASRAESAKQQAQYATVYARAVKSVLRSLVKVNKSQADLYSAADSSLRDVDKHKLSMLKSELGHQTHITKTQARSEAEQHLAEAKQASVVEIEKAKLAGRLIQIGINHRAALKAAQPKRQGLRLWN